MDECLRDLGEWLPNLEEIYMYPLEKYCVMRNILNLLLQVASMVGVGMIVGQSQLVGLMECLLFCFLSKKLGVGLFTCLMPTLS